MDKKEFIEKLDKAAYDHYHEHKNATLMTPFVLGGLWAYEQIISQFKIDTDNEIDRKTKSALWHIAQIHRVPDTGTQVYTAVMAAFNMGREYQQSKITAEDVKRWYQLLVGKGEKAMCEDLAKTNK